MGAMSDLILGGPAWVARLQEFDIQERPVVSGLSVVPGRALTARTTVKLTSDMVGAEVVVLFEGGDSASPIIVGVLQQPSEKNERKSSVQAEVDGDRLVLTADKEVVLRCGDASITLTRAGKIVIRGAYVLSQSTGYNKIKGASVDIN
jgi:hypothetical protein